VEDPLLEVDMVAGEQDPHEALVGWCDGAKGKAEFRELWGARR
jgi:hypothetical protein